MINFNVCLTGFCLGILAGAVGSLLNYIMTSLLNLMQS